MIVNKIIFLISIAVLLSSCAGNEVVITNNPDLDNPYLVSGFPVKKGNFEKELGRHKTNHKLVYIDTRPVELYREDMMKGIQSARSFGKNIGKKNVLFIPKIKSMKNLNNFSKKSKDFHDDFIGSRYSYQDAPFLIAFDGVVAKHVVPFTRLSHECRVKFLSELEHSVRINIFNDKISNKGLNIIEPILCETSLAIETSGFTHKKSATYIENIVRFLKSVFS